jgi:hypothetical protein
LVDESEGVSTSIAKYSRVGASSSKESLQWVHPVIGQVSGVEVEDDEELVLEDKVRRVDGVPVVTASGGELAWEDAGGLLPSLGGVAVGAML